MGCGASRVAAGGEEVSRLRRPPRVTRPRGTVVPSFPAPAPAPRAARAPWSRGGRGAPHLPAQLPGI